MAHFEAVLELAELPAHGMRACLLGGREIVICRTHAGIFALDNICTHAYARLSEGRLRATRLVCPLHAATFDIRNGRVLAPPAQVALTAHTVRLAAGMIEVALGESHVAAAQGDS